MMRRAFHRAELKTCFLSCVLVLLASVAARAGTESTQPIESRQADDNFAFGAKEFQNVTGAFFFFDTTKNQRPSIDYARRHYPANEFHCGTVEDLAATAPDPFDLVYTSEVIEHVPQVRSFCEHISNLLRLGGVLYITTPDITHWRRPRDVRQWDGFGPPAHLIYFNPKALTD